LYRALKVQKHYPGKILKLEQYIHEYSYWLHSLNDVNV